MASILKDIEKTASSEIVEQVRHLLAEVSVLVAINQILTGTFTANEKEDDTIFHCNECGTELH